MRGSETTVRNSPEEVSQYLRVFTEKSAVSRPSLLKIVLKRDGEPSQDAIFLGARLTEPRVVKGPRERHVTPRIKMEEGASAHESIRARRKETLPSRRRLKSPNFYGGLSSHGAVAAMSPRCFARNSKPKCLRTFLLASHTSILVLFARENRGFQRDDRIASVSFT